MEKNIMQPLKSENRPKLTPAMLLLPFDILMLSQRFAKTGHNKHVSKDRNLLASIRMSPRVINVVLCIVLLLLTGCTGTLN
ncbi:hypothetical protein C1N64_08195 [Pantoea sp. SGAir0215]